MLVELTLFICIFIFLSYFTYDFCKKRKKLSKDNKVINFTFFWVISFLFSYLLALFFRLMISLWILFFFLILVNEVFYFKVNTNEIRTDSWKTIIFQWMTHLWTKKFYKDIERIIKEYWDEWYTVFYEWIHWWSEEEIKKFDENLSIKLRPWTYEKLSWLFDWIIEQDYEEILFKNSENIKIHNADMWIWDMVMKYDEIKKEDKIQKSVNDKNIIDIEEINEFSIDTINQLEWNHLVQYWMKWSLNFVTWMNSKLRMLLLKINWTNTEFFEEIIINERNKNLAKMVHESEDKKILIIYGQEHYKWFIDELNKLEKIKLNIVTKELNPFKDY